MQKVDSIKTLEELKNGMFCSIGLPLTNSMVSNVTAMYLGKDKDGRYKSKEKRGCYNKDIR